MWNFAASKIPTRCEAAGGWEPVQPVQHTMRPAYAGRVTVGKRTTCAGGQWNSTELEQWFALAECKAARLGTSLRVKRREHVLTHVPRSKQMGVACSAVVSPEQRTRVGSAEGAIVRQVGDIARVESWTKLRGRC